MSFRNSPSSDNKSVGQVYKYDLDQAPDYHCTETELLTVVSTCRSVLLVPPALASGS